MATHWTLRSTAKARGLAPSAIHCIWREHGLKPRRVETFWLSNDPRSVEKVRDIVGLYVNPPEHALVLPVGEKSQTGQRSRRVPITIVRQAWLAAASPRTRAAARRQRQAAGGTPAAIGVASG